MNIQRIILTLAVLLLCGCSEPGYDLIIDERQKEYQLYDYYEDEYGNKGIVVYMEKIYGTEDFRYIIILSVDEAYLPWGPIDEIIYQRSDSMEYAYRAYDNYSYGVAMLSLMKVKGIDKYPAMAWCDKKNNGAAPYSGSWRLPTKGECIDIWGWGLKLDLEDLNSALVDAGGEPLSLDRYYWTCAEDYENYIYEVFDKDKTYVSDPSNKAIASLLEHREKISFLKKKNCYVRAIKYIYIKDF